MIRVYAFSETFPSYVPPDRKMKMLYAFQLAVALRRSISGRPLMMLDIAIFRVFIRCLSTR